jgi:hypothetical protein
MHSCYTWSLLTECFNEVNTQDRKCKQKYVPDDKIGMSHDFIPLRLSLRPFRKHLYIESSS